MINRYRWWEYVLIYTGIAVFLTFVLAPFLEAFLVSMRPIDALFSIPYRFITEEMSFRSYFTMWTSVPLLWLYMLNSLFIATAVTLLALLTILAGPVTAWLQGATDGLYAPAPYIAAFRLPGES